MRIRAEHIFIYMYVCLYISVKVSVQHNLVPRVGKKRDPGNEVACNSAQTVCMNDVRQKKGC